MDQHDQRPGEGYRDSLPGDLPGEGGSTGTPAFGAQPSGREAPIDRTRESQPAPDARTSGMRHRAEETINRGMQSAANRIEHAASQLDSLADERTVGAAGSRARAGETAHSLADAMESVASYLRDHDLEQLRGDLERQVREKPLQTLLVGAAAGWVFGKLVR